MKKTIFTGSGVAIVTPFHEGGVNYEALADLIEFQIKGNTDAIIICGTTGEASTMPDKEHLSVIEFAVKQVNGRIPVIAGAGSNDTVHGTELCREAEKLGADGLLLVTPYYNKATQSGLIKHYTYMADRVDIPIILYNVPSRTGVNIAIPTVAELAKHPNVVGIKEASGNIVTALQIKKACDLDLYSGNDDMITPIMSVGGKGVISVVANIMPQETHDICQKYLDGDVKGSLDLQLRLLPLVDALFCEVNPIPVKTALNLMGKNAGVLRLPLSEMSDEHTALLKARMQELALI